jgi:hypothetical protein
MNHYRISGYGFFQQKIEEPARGVFHIYGSFAVENKEFFTFFTPVVKS